MYADMHVCALTYSLHLNTGGNALAHALALQDGGEGREDGDEDGGAAQRWLRPAAGRLRRLRLVFQTDLVVPFKLGVAMRRPADCSSTKLSSTAPQVPHHSAWRAVCTGTCGL